MFSTRNILDLSIVESVCTISGSDTGYCAESIALKTGTISYEVLCGVARRVPRVYLERGKTVYIDEHLNV